MKSKQPGATKHCPISLKGRAMSSGRQERVALKILDDGSLSFYDSGKGTSITELQPKWVGGGQVTRLQQPGISTA